MSGVARFLTQVIRGLLLVLTTLEAIVALVLAINGKHLSDVLMYLQAAIATAAYAVAIGFIVPGRSRAAVAKTDHQNIRRARKVLLVLVAIEIAACLCASVTYAVTNQSIPSFGVAFTSGFPDWSTVIGSSQAEAEEGLEVCLDIPLLVMVLFLYTLDNRADSTE